MAPREVKVFMASVPDPENMPQPYPFKLQYLVLDDHGVPTGDIQEEQYTAAAHPGAGASFTASSILRWDPDTGKQGVDLNGIKLFFTRVLDEEDQARLMTALDDKYLSIEMEQIGDVYRWLVEEYSARPTQEQSGSRSSRRFTGLRSMDTHSEAAAT